jgi:HD-GYP domain-containing protein (c-di-GMP phosphodiesterase class II)
LRKKGQLTDTERQRMQEHPIEGAKQLIRWGRYSPLILRAALGALEHHMSRDSAAGGYPVFRDAYGVHVAGRIIAIADCFDAMTTKRLYRHAAMRRDEALARMLAESGSKFDPVLLKLFINMIGAYPIGTVVRLRSGRLGLVKAVPKDPRLCHRPVIAIIPDASGKRAHRAGVEELDLARSGPDGEPVDEIVAALDAAAMGVDVGRYFL